MMTPEWKVNILWQETTYILPLEKGNHMSVFLPAESTTLAGSELAEYWLKETSM